MKRVVPLGVILFVLSVLLVSGGASAQTMQVAWQSAYGTPYAVSVNSSDNSVWAATGNGVMHVALAGTVQSQTDGFFEPQAIIVNAADGTVWVADTGHDQVVKLSGSGDELLRLNGFSGPSALALDPDNSFCWVADTGNDAVVQLDMTTGHELWRSAAGVFQTPRSVSVNTFLHTCWVADTSHSQVVQLNSDGSEAGRYSGFTQPASVSIKDLDFHPNVWVADTGGNRIVQLDENGAVVTTTTGFSSPAAVSTDSTTGVCWATDTGHGQVVHLGLDGKAIFRGGPFGAPISVTTNPTDGSCWVGDSANGLITHLAAAGTILEQKSLITLTPLVSASAPDGTLWVGTQGPWDGSTSEYTGSAVMHIGLDGTVLATSPAYVQDPTCIAVNPTDGSVWVGDENVSKVFHLDSSGGVSFESADGQFSYPSGIAVNPTTGDAWIADYSTTDVVHLSAAGTEVNRVLGLGNPAAIALDTKDSTLWVADFSLNQVVHLDASGTPTASYPFSGPQGVAVYPGAGSASSTVWVGDHDYIYHINTDGTVIWQSAAYAGAIQIAVNPSDGTVACITWTQPAVLTTDGRLIWSDTTFGNSCIALCPDDSFWVGDSTARIVRHLAADGEVVAQVGGFCQPSSVSTLASDHTVWVADAGNGRAVHLDSGGAVVSQKTGLTFPVSVSVDQTSGLAWVADKTGNALYALQSDATVAASATGLATPQSVAANSHDDTAWVGLSGQVGHYAETGTQMFLGGTFGTSTSVAVNPTDDSVWVADTSGNQVVHLSASGAPIGSAVTGFSQPSAIAVYATDGSVWVADSTKVYKLSSSGTVQWNGSGFHAPVGLAVNGGDGSAWVADTNGGAVVHLQADGSELWRDTDFVSPVGVTVLSSDGSVWVADRGLNQVIKLVTAPTAAFSATPIIGYAPLPVTFTDASPNSPTAWLWDFGDGTAPSTVQNPSHTYTSPGTYAVTLTATGIGGAAVLTKEHYIVVSFPDVSVSPAYWALLQILACVDAWVVAGFPDGTYGPALPVTRDQMAVYISRALAGGDAAVPTPPTGTQSFPDVTSTYWAYKYIEYAKAKGVVAGFPDGTYQPAVVVTRDQMAVYIARAIATPTAGADLVNYTPPATATFPDVPTDFWAYKYVEYIAQPGIAVTVGYPDGDYHPEYACTRDQMAVYVQRAFQLPM